MRVIGQKDLINFINNSIDNFPRFCIICGPKGSGKRTIEYYIQDMLGIEKVNCGLKVNEVRNYINMAYTQNDRLCYVFEDCDDMSLNAKNALLKVTEEPPKESYFIMTVCDINKVLETLISRGTVLKISPYSKEELIEYIDYSEHKLTKDQRDLVLKLCTYPGEIEDLLTYDIEEFYEYCELILDNISRVPVANALKITSKFAIKDKGYDIRLVLNAIQHIAMQRLIEEKDTSYVEVIKLCSAYKVKNNSNTINKQMMMDDWVFSMRKALK